MYRSIWWICLPSIALAACGTENDQRPRSVQYITEAILAPSCGNAQCHSSFRNAQGYTFDTVEKAQQSLVGGLVGVISLNDRDEPQGEGASSFLYTVLTRSVDRMPYDQPLPDADLDLIERWIDFGAPGAQCNPVMDGGMICVGRKVVECRETFNFGAVIEDCATTGKNCSAGACR
jgi:hypothetical protein